MSVTLCDFSNCRPSPPPRSVPSESPISRMVRCLLLGSVRVWDSMVVVVLVVLVVLDVLDVVEPSDVVVVDDEVGVALLFKLTAKTTMEVTIKPIIRTAISAVRNFFTGVARLSGTPPVSTLQLVNQSEAPRRDNTSTGDVTRIVEQAVEAGRRGRRFVRGDRRLALQRETDVVPAVEEPVARHGVEDEGSLPADLGHLDAQVVDVDHDERRRVVLHELSLIHIFEPTRPY